MCLMKSGESGKGCKGPVVQTDKRGQNQRFLCNTYVQVVLYLIGSEIGSQ